MSAVHHMQPTGAICELQTDEPLPVVVGRLRAYGITGAHVEVRGRRRWLVVDAQPDNEQPDDYPHTRAEDREPDEASAPWWIVLGPIALIVAALVWVAL